MSIDTNYIINTDSGVTAGYSVSPDTTTDCPNGVVVVKNGSSTNLKIGVITYDSGNNPLAYEIRQLSNDASSGGSLNFTALDDAVSYFEVYRDASFDGTSMSGTQLTAPDGTTTQFTVGLTYGNGNIASGGTAYGSPLYTSTNYEVTITNNLNEGVNYRWSVDGNVSGKIEAGTTKTITLTAGDGQLNCSWGSGSTASFDVYDMTSSTCTITGTGVHDAQPMVITPSGGQVTLVNQTDGTLTAYFLGESPHNTPAGGPPITLTADATSTTPWYVKWEVNGDPKIIVRRPATLTQ